MSITSLISYAYYKLIYSLKYILIYYILSSISAIFFFFYVSNQIFCQSNIHYMKIVSHLIAEITVLEILFN